MELRKERKEKRKSINNIIKHEVCEGRRYSNMVLKAVEKWRVRERVKGE
jgi:hypothetical protein